MLINSFFLPLLLRVSSEHQDIDPQPIWNPSFLNSACLLSTDEGTEYCFDLAGYVSIPSTPQCLLGWYRSALVSIEGYLLSFCLLDWTILPTFQILTCAGRGGRLMLLACFVRKSALVEMDRDRWRMWDAPENLHSLAAHRLGTTPALLIVCGHCWPGPQATVILSYLFLQS